MAIQTGVLYPRQDTLDKSVPQAADSCHLLGQALLCQLHRLSQTDDARHIMRCGPPPSFLLSPMHKRIDLDALSYIEDACSLGAA